MSYLNEVNNLTDSDSLRQGENFQGRLDYYTNIQEKFDTMTWQNQSDASDKIITNNNTFVENYQNNSTNYQTALREYKEHKNDVENRRNQYYHRTDISNIYLNKNIKFSNGKIFHVTNQGVARHVPTDKVTNILGKNGCSSTIIDINIPWDDKYLIKGTVIPTTPTLITGTVMKENGSCGNEGKNVRVAPMVSDSSDIFVGCFKDDVNNPKMRMMEDNPYIKKNEFTFDDCKNFAIDGGNKYFALQDVSPTTEKGFCAVSNNITDAITTVGVIPNKAFEIWKATVSPVPGTMAKITNNGSLEIITSSGTTIFSTPSLVTDTLSSNYFLMIEDNGNVSIYKGSNINDKQELIWQTGTSGKTIEQNDKYNASKCKFGSHIMTSGATLASGEFIGSPSGSCYLMMNPDGNLVLYTSKTTSGCFDLKNNKQAGLTGMNSIYELAQTGYKSILGSFMYIDEDGNTAYYPESMLEYGDTFTELQNYESSGNDIGQCTKPTIDECLTECKNNKDCYAMNSGKWMKNKDFMKNLYPLKNSKMFIRDKKKVEGFSGDNKDIPLVDTYKFNNYSPTTININNADSISGDIRKRDNDIKQLKENNLNSSAQTLNTDFKTAQTNYIAANNKLRDNHTSISNYYSEYNEIHDKFETGNKYLNDYNRMVHDTNTVLLQENRLYIFLFILLILSLIIFIQVLKLNKQ